MLAKTIVLWLGVGLIAGGAAKFILDHAIGPRQSSVEQGTATGRSGKAPARRRSGRYCGMQHIPIPALIESRQKVPGTKTPCGTWESTPDDSDSVLAGPPDREQGWRGGFASSDTQWEEIEATDGRYLVQEMGKEGREIATSLHRALFRHLESALPTCFDGVEIPDTPHDPYFEVAFLLDIETGEGELELAKASVFNISYSDEALEKCFLDHFKGKGKIEATSIIGPGRRSRVIFPMSFQIAKIVDRNQRTR